MTEKKEDKDARRQTNTEISSVENNLEKKKKSMEIDELVEEFKKIDTSEYPDFHNLETNLEKALWVLYVAEKKMDVDRLNAKEIATIILKSLKVNVTYKEVVLLFNESEGNIIHLEAGCYTIMQGGIDLLLPEMKNSVELFHFEPKTKFASKRILYKNILKDLKGELRIVDPYCGLRTLDILRELGIIHIKFLTNTDLFKKEEKKEKFKRELKDYMSENQKAAFRDVLSKDIHDRYIISSNSLIISGHSIKDLGNKESFIIQLDKSSFRDIYEAQKATFDKRWDAADPIIQITGRT